MIPPDISELLRAFLRKWSTQIINEDAREILRDDVMQLTAIFDVYGVSTNILNEALEAPDRHWFAAQYNKLKKE